MSYSFGILYVLTQYYLSNTVMICLSDTFVPSRYFRINEFSGLLNCPSVQKQKSVPALFVRISEISRLSEPRLTNHHCMLFLIIVLKSS